jgi:hypothetical protein
LKAVPKSPYSHYEPGSQSSYNFWVKTDPTGLHAVQASGSTHTETSCRFDPFFTSGEVHPN